VRFSFRIDIEMDGSASMPNVHGVSGLAKRLYRSRNPGEEGQQKQEERCFQSVCCEYVPERKEVHCIDKTGNGGHPKQRIWEDSLRSQRFPHKSTLLLVRLKLVADP